MVKNVFFWTKCHFLKILIMKKTQIIIIFISLLLFSACNDLLDKMPNDRLYPEVYFSSEAELQLFTNQFYNKIIPNASDIYAESSDLIVKSDLMLEISGQRIVPDEGNGWNFDVLRDINFYLEHSHNCKDEKARNKYDAVARFFRAYFYFEKVKRYGDVPWYDKVLESNDKDLYKARDSRELIMQEIIEDLNFAIDNLPTERNPYIVTKWVALALKSRACLFEGTFRKYHSLEDYEKYLDECISSSETLMNEGEYELYKNGDTPYLDLFSSMNLNKDEIIFGRDYEQSLSIMHNVQNYENSTTLGRPGLNKKIVNYYLTNTGERFTDKPNYDKMTIDEECLNRDPRMSQTIRTVGYKRKGESKYSSPNLSYSITGYHLIKYSMESKYDEYNKSCNDIPLFRLAEIYLNLAEAKAERGSLKQEDLDNTINKLRSRVKMPNLNMEIANANPDNYLLSKFTGFPNVDKGPNKGVILEIRRERTIELVMEGFRYYDIMRWKEGKIFENDLLGIYIPGPGSYDLNGDGTNDVCFYIGTKPSEKIPLYLEIGNNVQLSDGNSGNIICHKNIRKTWNEEKDYLYPIPINERILSNGNLTQNPGWNDGLNF